MNEQKTKRKNPLEKLKPPATTPKKQVMRRLLLFVLRFHAKKLISILLFYFHIVDCFLIFAALVIIPKWGCTKWWSNRMKKTTTKTITVTKRITTTNRRNILLELEKSLCVLSKQYFPNALHWEAVRCLWLCGNGIHIQDQQTRCERESTKKKRNSYAPEYGKTVSHVDLWNL